jgi:hypothetical protein
VFLSNAAKGGAAEPATIQCKFTSKASGRLKASDLREEEQHIAELVAAGNANTYVLMTNMSVDAPVALAIRRRLRELGVRRPHILGREFLTEKFARALA